MKYMSSAALITSTPVTRPTNSTTYLRNRPRFMRAARVWRTGCDAASLATMVTPAGLQGQAVCVSFDDLVGRTDDARRDAESDVLRCAQTDDELDLVRLDDRQVRGLGSFQDALHVARDLAKLGGEIGTIGHQP